MKKQFNCILKSLLITFIFLLVTFTSTSASANQADITYLKIDVEIKEDLSLNETNDIILNSKEQTDFHLFLPNGCTNLERLYNCEKIDYASNQIIKLAPNELNNIKISYNIPNAIEQKKNDFVYMKELVYPNVKNLIFRIKLPQAYGIDSEDISTIIPEPTYLQSDGKRIIVLWEMKSPKTPVIFKIKYRSLVENNGIGNNILISLGSIIIGLAVLGFIIFNKISKAKETEIKIPPSLLSEDEMIICDIIHNEGGKIKQKKLSSMTGFSKAKITKILANLEKKELIEKEPIGRTFIINLKKKIDH